MRWLTLANHINEALHTNTQRENLNTPAPVPPGQETATIPVPACETNALSENSICEANLWVGLHTLPESGHVTIKQTILNSAHSMSCFFHGLLSFWSHPAPSIMCSVDSTLHKHCFCSADKDV